MAMFQVSTLKFIKIQSFMQKEKSLLVCNFKNLLLNLKLTPSNFSKIQNFIQNTKILILEIKMFCLTIFPLGI